LIHSQFQRLLIESLQTILKGFFECWHSISRFCVSILPVAKSISTRDDVPQRTPFLCVRRLEDCLSVFRETNDPDEHTEGCRSDGTLRILLGFFRSEFPKRIGGLILSVYGKWKFFHTPLETHFQSKANRFPFAIYDSRRRFLKVSCFDNDESLLKVNSAF
jgi:hypothetical protein